MPEQNLSSDVSALSMEAQWRRWLNRYTWHLDQVPALLEGIRSDVARISSDSARYGGERVSSSREGAPVPFRVDAMDDSDDLWAALVQYTANVAELLDEPGPGGVALTWRSRGEAAGIPSSATLRDVRFAAFEIVAWILQRVEAIASLQQLEGTEDFLFWRIRSFRARYTSRPKPQAQGFCDHCGETAVVSEWTGGDGTVLASRCSACGLTSRTERIAGRSTVCADADHVRCVSLLCSCDCHQRRVSLFTARTRVEPAPEGMWRLAPFSESCDHGDWSPYLGADDLRHCGGCGQVL